MPVTRRAFLSTLCALPLAGCSSYSGSPSTNNTPSDSPTPTVVSTVNTPGLIALEERYNAQLGVYALNTGTGTIVAHNADERFAFCSTFKALAAAAILNYQEKDLDSHVIYNQSDILEYAPITSQNVHSGMTLRELCDAAVCYSDNTAANLLLRRLGGPAALTAYTRTLGDTVFQMERIEPAISETTPGQTHDTTSPRAFGEDFRALVLGEALRPTARDLLRNWLLGNITGATRIRAAIPPKWMVADKTGTGNYGTENDIAVLWPPSGSPLILAIMSHRATRDADPHTPLIAETTHEVLAALGFTSTLPDLRNPAEIQINHEPKS